MCWRLQPCVNVHVHVLVHVRPSSPPSVRTRRARRRRCAAWLYLLQSDLLWLHCTYYGYTVLTRCAAWPSSTAVSSTPRRRVCTCMHAHAHEHHHTRTRTRVGRFVRRASSSRRWRCSSHLTVLPGYHPYQARELELEMALQLALSSARGAARRGEAERRMLGVEVHARGSACTPRGGVRGSPTPSLRLRGVRGPTGARGPKV